MLTAETKKRFLELAEELAPEKLSCNYRLPPGQVRIAYNRVMARWRKLEREVGQTVGEADLWRWRLEEQRQQQPAAITDGPLAAQ